MFVIKIVLLIHPFVVMVWQELDNVVEELQKFAVVHLVQDRSVISLIGNAQMSPLILEKVKTTDTLCK